MPNHVELRFSSDEKSREPNSADNPIDVFVNDLISGCSNYMRERRRGVMSYLWSSRSRNTASHMMRAAENFEQGDNVYSLLMWVEHAARNVVELRQIVAAAADRLFDSSETLNEDDYQTYRAETEAQLVRQEVLDAGFALPQPRPTP